MHQTPPVNRADPTSLQQALNEGATLVTGSQRLARRMLGDEARRRRAGGQAVWQKPDVLPWQAWLERAHTSALAGGLVRSGESSILLSDAQIEALWQQIIEADLSDDQALLRPAAAARQAMETHNLCLAWRLEPGVIAAASPQQDASAFLKWWQAFNRRLEQGGWITPGELADRACEWFAREARLRPTALWLAGFEEFTPQQNHLLEQLVALGTPVHTLPWPTRANARAEQLPCLDPEPEFMAAAGWARNRLEQNPDATLGIVVPDLAENRALLIRHLNAALDPPSRRTPGRSHRHAFNISLGKPLNAEAMVYDALLMLNAVTGSLDFTAASRLLRSAFVGGAESERARRMKAELMLRDAGELQIRIEWLAEMLLRPGKYHQGACCPDLGKRIKTLSQLIDNTNKVQDVTAWATQFSAVLEALGWPGERPLDSHEFQVKMKFQELLGELGSLATVLPQLTRGGALTRLRRLAANTLFQAQSSPAPIQVMGLLETIGQTFDALWVCGLDDERWPQSPRPDPFLPTRLQREYKLPHANAEREYAFAQTLTQRLLQAAPEIVVSWPRQKDERILRASSLIAHLPDVKAAGAFLETSTAGRLESVQLEWLDDAHGPPLSDTDSLFKPGKDIFVNQSNCPFRGFAVHRLGAARLEPPQPGLNAPQRGVLVHKILERLWRNLGTRTALLALTAQMRDALVAECVADTIESCRSRIPALFSPAFADLEQRRLELLIAKWLEQECSRPEFTVIKREEVLPVDIGTHTVKLRIDRVDELPDGSLVLIDYKSGESKDKTLEPERDHRAPDPQLPVYATRFDNRLAGVLFGQVRSQQCKWVGVTRNDVEAPGTKTSEDWPALRAAWREMTSRLTTDFQAGNAQVDPLKDACKYCHLSGLCRIHERALDTGKADA